MSFKKALTKMGLVEEEVVVAPKKAAPAPQPQQPAVMTQYGDYHQNAAPSADPAITEMLQKSLDASKLTGFDYMKFVSSVEKMKSAGISEEARYKAVFSTAQELGVNKESLTKSGEHYLQVLKEDEDDFGADCDQFEKDEIKARQAKLSKIESTITDLSKQLAGLQQDHETLTQEVQEQTARLEVRRQSFQATLQQFKSVIESNLQKINQFLQ